MSWSSSPKHCTLDSEAFPSPARHRLNGVSDCLRNLLLSGPAKPARRSSGINSQHVICGLMTIRLFLFHIFTWVQHVIETFRHFSCSESKNKTKRKRYDRCTFFRVWFLSSRHAHDELVLLEREWLKRLFSAAFWVTNAYMRIDMLHKKPWRMGGKRRHQRKLMSIVRDKFSKMLWNVNSMS